jgi:hypothetical protein
VRGTRKCHMRRRHWLDSAHGNSGGAAMLAEAAAEEAAAAAALGVRRVGAVEDLRCLEEDLDSNVERRCVPYFPLDGPRALPSVHLPLPS